VQAESKEIAVKSNKGRNDDSIEGRIIGMLQNVWQTICFDVLGAEGNCIARDEVIDCVADSADHSEDVAAFEAFKDLSFDDQERVGKIAFPDPEYGW